MDLRTLAAKLGQTTPQQEQPAPVNQLDKLARLIAAQEAEKKLYSLSELLQTAIDTGATPFAMLQTMAGFLYGAGSPQAAAIEAAIKAAETRPAALEMELATLRAQRAALKRKHKQQADALAATAAQLEELAQQEKEVNQRIKAAAAFDDGLSETLIFYKQQQLKPTADAIESAAFLLQKHKGSPAAVAMLRGILLFLQAQHIAGRMQYTLPQLEQLATLLQEVAQPAAN